MHITEVDVVFIDLIIGGLFMTAYIYRPFIRYALIGLLALSLASFQFYLLMNKLKLDDVYNIVFR